MRIPRITQRNPIHRFALLGCAVALALLGTQPAAAQADVEYSVQPASKLWVEGTSNKSDFSVNASTVEGSFDISGSGADVSVASGEIAVQAKDLKGGKSTIMDRLMYDALMVDEHPTITYHLAAAENATAAASDGTFTLATTGKLTLTGTTKDVEIEVTGAPQADGSIRFTGSHALKMSDYGMTPPTAMFGALRTSDDVTIHFDIVAAPAK